MRQATRILSSARQLALLLRASEAAAAGPSSSGACSLPAPPHWSSGGARHLASGTPAAHAVLASPDGLLPDADPGSDLEDAVQLEETPEEADASAAAFLSAAAAAAGGDALSGLPPGGALAAEVSVAGRTYCFETGRLARLADGSCTLRCGDTLLLATVVCDAGATRHRDAPSPPLEVEYREKQFAVGRIPSTYNKREGAAKEGEVLAGQRLERALRPLFPRGFAHDTQVTASVLGADGGADLDVMAINAASAALAVSDVPWGGPVGAARAAVLADGSLVANPPPAALEAARLSLLVAVTGGGEVVLMEAEGREASGGELLSALRLGVAEATAMLAPQLDLAAQAGRRKRAVTLAGADPAAEQKVLRLALPRVEAALRDAGLGQTRRARALADTKAAILTELKASGSFRADFARVAGSGCVSPADLDHAFGTAVARALRGMVVGEGVRPDGRGLVDLRPLRADLDWAPVVHGSALLSAGETQALCTATVGGRAEHQRTETLLGGEGSKRLFVHATSPPYASAESRHGQGGSGGSQRREMGLSQLVERAVAGVLPGEGAFPFAVRVNTDLLAANGGAGMAAVCGAALALADAGVPLAAPLAGVSVGLLAAAPAEWEAGVGRYARAPRQYDLLTDLSALEEWGSEAELVMAGSAAGVTACQLSMRQCGGLPLAAVEEAIAAGRAGLDAMLPTLHRALPAQRPQHAPVFGSVTVPEAMLGRVIGPGGAHIREVEEGPASARVNVGQGGVVHIFAPSAAQFALAKARVLDLAGETIKEGELYRGRVVELRDFGAFVELEGSTMRCLLHISEIAAERIRSVEEALEVGQGVEVLCMGRDARGNVKISRKAATARQKAAAAPAGE